MKPAVEQLYDLYLYSKGIFEKYQPLQPKDIRRVYTAVIHSQITVSLTNLQINMEFAGQMPEAFLAHFNGDHKQMDNYTTNIIENSGEAILDTALMQSELIMRVIYSKLTGEPIGDASIPRIIHILYQDVENNWQKEESKFLDLFWTLRNTIHTGGIYMKNPAGKKMVYQGDEYIFEYAKAPGLLKTFSVDDQIKHLLDAMVSLFESQHVQDLGYIEHPNFFALGL